ncbi:Nif-specific regulatory protein [Clostridium formicaceticum]|uniref:Nif-specific regulatory protein n=1 Tax=Clostridium formicaceticum TaxID=1497 RepID=A0AAC9RID7_9CLOT|nr:sigma 54-interacting transcriptional regulator [Clostridium formicaceticum]AOY77108.1 hypothetical protein BJL90_15380 [Clostridium formicaceticum]ARE87619.1 Nif-specific regulatory protein [Clostridium formicaceticum]
MVAYGINEDCFQYSKHLQMIEKIGAKELIPIDVRVIAATNQDLERKVLEGEFRQDLFYRINVIP